MFNLAGRRDCDVFIKVELESAGFERLFLPAGCKYDGEVHWSVYAEFRGWKFIRAWSYWVAAAKEPEDRIPKIEAEALNCKWGKEIRFDGFAGGTKVDTNAKLYHIDTEAGLREFWHFLNSKYHANNIEDKDENRHERMKEYYKLLLESYKE